MGAEAPSGSSLEYMQVVVRGEGGEGRGGGVEEGEGRQSGMVQPTVGGHLLCTA